MEVEREEMEDSSRLYKILVMEREGEDLEKSERIESAFSNIKKTLSKKFSFKKLKTSTKGTAKVQEFTCSQNIFDKLTDSIRNCFTKQKLKKTSVTNSIKDE